MVVRDVNSYARFPKHGRGWNGVARAIVTDMADRLPPPAPNWPDWMLTGIRYYREDGSLVVDTYEGRWRDEQTGEGGTVFSLLERLLGSRGAARRWLRDNGYMWALGPGPRRSPGGSREVHRSDRVTGADRFWNPVRRPEQDACPAPSPPAADQLELWPDETEEIVSQRVMQRNLEAAARHKAEEERRWQVEMAKLSPAERNFKEAQRAKRHRR